MRIKRVFFSAHFQRALKHLGPQYMDIIAERFSWFKENCFDSRLKTHKLEGKLKGYWSFSLTYSHRVVFEFIEKDVVGFVNIGDHSIYQ